jgi:hypothetical protein
LPAQAAIKVPVAAAALTDEDRACFEEVSLSFVQWLRPCWVNGFAVACISKLGLARTVDVQLNAEVAPKEHRSAILRQGCLSTKDLADGYN